MYQLLMGFALGVTYSAGVFLSYSHRIRRRRRERAHIKRRMQAVFEKRCREAVEVSKGTVSV